MKKIMFSDRFGLTKAVLEGRKTMTRRIVPESLQETFSKCSQGVLVVPIEAIPENLSVEEFARNWCETGSIPKIMHGKQSDIQFIDILDMVIEHSRFKTGDVVAVAQNYEDAGIDPETLLSVNRKWVTACGTPGWRNKMFVSADYMNNFIRITNIKVERLQDISDEDCLREGVRKMTFDTFSFDSWKFFTRSPREAFAALIAKVSGKGIWDRNPWVFVYEFELVN